MVDAIHKFRKCADCSGSKPLARFLIASSGSEAGGGLGGGDSGMISVLRETEPGNNSHDTDMSRHDHVCPIT
jgi:hypothetical protein